MRRRDPLEAAAKLFGYAAAFCLLFMMLFTTVAVVMREAFNAPVFGVVDIMELALVGCVFIALPGVFLRDENITVDVVDQVAGRRTRTVLRFAGLLLSLVFLVVMLSQMFVPALDKLMSGEVTMTLGFSRFYHWVPIILGFVFSIVATVLVMIRYARHGVPGNPTVDGTGPDSRAPGGGAETLGVE